MTSTRFLGPIGIGEILVSAAVMVLSLRYARSAFSFAANLGGSVKLYMFLSVYVALPIMTLTTWAMTDRQVTPLNLVSFGLAWWLCFVVVAGLRSGLDIRYLSRVYAFVFIGSFFISYLFFPSYFDDRFMGFASDPNQLMFYVSSLSVLLALHDKRLFVFLFPVIVWIGFQSGSDSYFLQLAMTLVMAVLFYFFFSSRLVFWQRVLISLFVLIPAVVLLLSYWWDAITLLWKLADEGGYRLSLFRNAFKAALESPIFGHGAGIFSGNSAPFEGREAHNTFLDFSAQFGFLFPLVVYMIVIKFLLRCLADRRYLEPAFVVSFLLSGLFHYNGRHFIFWVLLSVFYFHAFSERYPRPLVAESSRGEGVVAGVRVS